jgi:hypothetical protein
MASWLDRLGHGALGSTGLYKSGSVAHLAAHTLQGGHVFMGNQGDRAALYKKMLCHIADFESLMAEVEDSLPPITRKDVLHIKKAIAILKALPTVGPITVPDYISAITAETKLKKIVFESAGLTVSVGFALARLTRSVTNWLH